MKRFECREKRSMSLGHRGDRRGERKDRLKFFKTAGRGLVTGALRDGAEAIIPRCR